MFLGNDINDIPAFKLLVFLRRCRFISEIKKYVIYKTKANGGHGAVREICDLIYNAKRKKIRKYLGNNINIEYVRIEERVLLK